MGLHSLIALPFYLYMIRNYFNGEETLRITLFCIAHLSLLGSRQYNSMYVCMYVCIRGGHLQPLHLDPQWSIVLNPDDR
jgi:hypothetical protein